MAVEDEDEIFVEPDRHEAARPMRVVVDKNGCTWLCDADVNEKKDLKEQGCWRCDALAFTRDD
jgi:hypothetical protein